MKLILSIPLSVLLSTGGCQGPSAGPAMAPEAEPVGVALAAGPAGIPATNRVTRTAPAPAENKRPANEPNVAGGLRLVNAPVTVALEVYGGISGKKVVIPPEVRKSPARITVDSGKTVKRAEAIRLLEKALREQAGLAVTPLQDGRLSVGPVQP